MTRPDVRTTRLPAFAVVGLLVLVAVSRLAALPASIWEQDEAYFAMAAERFDPAHNRPQPPWSPLWVGIGHAGRLAGIDPAQALRLASLAAGVLALLPLSAMWVSVLDRRSAMLAALLFLATPVAWLSAGRALSETPATLALAVMCACWCRPRGGESWLAAGSVAGGVAVLVRPQLALAVALPALAAILTSRTRREQGAVALPGVLLGLAGALATVAAAGGVEPLLQSFSRHAALHFGQLRDVSYALSRSGLARSLLHPAVAVAWVALALLGAADVLRTRGESRRSAALIVLALTGTVLAIYGPASPQHARYFIPVLALSAGLVVAGLDALLDRRWAAVAALAVVAAYAWTVVPALALYRRQPSPPIAALRLAAERQRADGAAVVVDRRLNAFAEWERAFEAPDLKVVYDFEAQLGLGGLDAAREVVAVYDANHPLSWLPDVTPQRISWPDDPLRTLSPDRYVDVSVAVTRAGVIPSEATPR